MSPAGVKQGSRAHDNAAAAASTTLQPQSPAALHQSTTASAGYQNPFGAQQGARDVAASKPGPYGLQDWNRDINAPFGHLPEHKQLPAAQTTEAASDALRNISGYDRDRKQQLASNDIASRDSQDSRAGQSDFNRDTEV